MDEERRGPGGVCRANHPGGLFFGSVSFGRAKEMNPTAVREPHQNQSCAQRIQKLLPMYLDFYLKGLVAA